MQSELKNETFKIRIFNFEIGSRDRGMIFFFRRWRMEVKKQSCASNETFYKYILDLKSAQRMLKYEHK